MLSPYSPLISEVVSNAEGPYIRTKNYDKDNDIVGEENTQYDRFFFFFSKTHITKQQLSKHHTSYGNQPSYLMSYNFQM